MKNYAVVKNDFVENLIACEEAQVSEMEEVLQCELVDSSPFGLNIGDMRVLGEWTRNIDGVQTVLTERATYEELEKALYDIQEMLNGGVTNDKGTA